MSTKGELLEWGVELLALQHFTQVPEDDPAGALYVDGEPYVSGAGGADGAPHAIEDDGAPVTPRGNLNFTGDGVTLSDDGDTTVVTIAPNQTAAEIKTAYESNSDTNAFSDAEKAKLATDITPGHAAIQIPGTVFEPPASGGSEGFTSEELGSNVLLFNKYLDAIDSYSMASNVLMPLNYDSAGAFDVQVEWSADSAITNAVRFTIQTASQGEGAALNVALNTATAIEDTNSAVANQRHVTPWAALSVSGIAPGDSFLLRLDRTATHASDTLPADVRVHAVRVRYTTKAI